MCQGGREALSVAVRTASFDFNAALLRIFVDNGANINAVDNVCIVNMYEFVSASKRFSTFTIDVVRVHALDAR